MHKQHLQLYKSSDGNFRTVFKNNHGRMIYLAVSVKDNGCKITECYYVDRIKEGQYYAVPKRLVTLTFPYGDILSVIKTELDKDFPGIETFTSLSYLTTEEFITHKLSELNRGYKFLIFVGKGESVNGIPSVLKTRFKNRIHRSIYLELQYRLGKGVITDCRYYDREYRSRDQVVPETLHTVHFEYNRQAILNIVNNELNTAFTDIIFVTDGSIDICKKLPVCGYIT